ncbi:TIGR03862 family flavoprotein [Kordiimonas sp.]|uniref:TIGR03862 family flavoprotein n=1 Tax=Kordiimonas sp. TaxID=1970157 RepID=UPI003A8C95A4
MPDPTDVVDFAIIGAGPAGLMAAEVLCAAGHKPHVFEAMPTPARKFLMAGKSGLNITHSEPIETFLTRYGATKGNLETAIRAFSPNDIKTWANGLGIETFTGSSGRIFPTAFKASPLLRSWLKRLEAGGAHLHTRHRLVSLSKNGDLTFTTPEGEKTVAASSVLYALGGASWPKLGANGDWQNAFKHAGVELVDFQPSNCGFDCGWSSFFTERFAGEPVKNVKLCLSGQVVQGDFVVTRTGVEGSAIYALSAQMREAISSTSAFSLTLDLTPDRSLERLSSALSQPRGKKSFATFLKKTTGLTGVKAALLREACPDLHMQSADVLAALIKACPLPIKRPRPIEEAISSAGGVKFEAFDENLMLRAMPGHFCAGEMIDWDAPTGGYLLTACFAQGRQAAHGMLTWQAKRQPK